MVKKEKIICLIPIRLKSKRIKNKNLIKIKDQPLFKYVYNKISKSKKIDRFYIATDKVSNLKKILTEGDKLKYFPRSKKSSTDKAPTERLIEEFFFYHKPDILVLLQVTNPFVDFKIIDSAINKLLKKKYDSIFSAVRSKSFLWKQKKYAQAINYDYKKRKMSQNINSYFVENGSFYIFWRKNFKVYKNRLHKKIGIFEMSKESVHEIDDIDDYLLIKKILN